MKKVFTDREEFENAKIALSEIEISEHTTIHYAPSSESFTKFAFSDEIEIW